MSKPEKQVPPKSLESHVAKLLDVRVTWLSENEVEKSERTAKHLDTTEDKLFCKQYYMDALNVCMQQLDKYDENLVKSFCDHHNSLGTFKVKSFVDRTSLKLANLDAMLDFMFTKPVSQNGMPLLCPGDKMYIIDICGSPGGFIDYMIWRGKKDFIFFGYGNEYKLWNQERTQQFHVFKGFQKKFNPTDPENIVSFCEYVLDKSTDGVQVIIADGCIYKNYNKYVRATKEVKNKQLHLCNCIIALKLLRTDGHFIMKLFDMITPFTVGLVYLMYKCFHSVCIVKPPTSRNTNSERYLVCKWKRPNTMGIYDKLIQINMNLIEQKETAEDITPIVPVSDIIADRKFYEYIRGMNDKLASIQLNAMQRLVEDIKTMHPKEKPVFSNLLVQNQCYKIWNLPEIYSNNNGK